MYIWRLKNLIDNYLLEELVTFKQTGTLAATAEVLSVTQPTVTRGMQKLEDELGVSLFNRQPNQLTLTETGELAASEAQKVLATNQQFIQTVQNFEFSHQQIKVGSIAPGPLIVLNHSTLPKNVDISNDFVDKNDVISKLEQNNFSLIISNQEIMTDTIESRFIGTERLSVNLDKFTYLANLRSIKFDELKGLSFIVLNDIGIWKEIIQDHIPQAKFLYQDQVDAFTEITKYSNFPYFSTNVSPLKKKHRPTENDDRVLIPIVDTDAKMDFYVVYLKNQKKHISNTIKALSTEWNKLE